MPLERYGRDGRFRLGQRRGRRHQKDSVNTLTHNPTPNPNPNWEPQPQNKEKHYEAGTGADEVYVRTLALAFGPPFLCVGGFDETRNRVRDLPSDLKQ